MRHPARWVASLAVIAAITAIALVALAGRTQRGTGRGARRVDLRPGCPPCLLAQTAAHGYNPFGTGPENRDQIENVVDSDPNTTWSTEQYYDGTLKKTGGEGVGLYLDASPGVRRQGDRNPDAHAGVRGADLRGQQRRAVAPLRRLDAARRPRLAGTGRAERATSATHERIQLT